MTAFPMTAKHSSSKSSFSRRRRPTRSSPGADDGEGVREVEDGELVELGDHRHPAVPAGRFDVLAEGVAVAHRDGARQRREEPDLVLAEEAAARERRLPGRQDDGLREELLVAPHDVEDGEAAEGVGGPAEVDDPRAGEHEAGEAGGIPPGRTNVMSFIDRGYTTRTLPSPRQGDVDGTGDLDQWPGSAVRRRTPRTPEGARWTTSLWMELDTCHCWSSGVTT